MFEGSEHHDSGFFQPLQAAGASLNGSTNADRTNYWEVVPTGALELALWMESDRMGYLLPALTEAEVHESARRRAERAAAELREPAVRPGVDGHARGALSARSPVPLDDDRRDRRSARGAARRGAEFFRRYYHPANASIALAGDIDPEAALALVRAYFEPIAAGEPVAPVRRAPRRYGRAAHPARRSRRAAAPLPRRGSRRRCSTPATRISIWRRTCWPTARRRGSTGGWCTTSGSRPTCPPRRTRGRSRASSSSRRRPRPVTRSPRSSASSSRRSSRLAAGGRPTTSSSAAACRSETQFVLRLQTVGGFGGKSDQLNAYNILLGEPDYFERDLARYQQVTAASLQGRRGAVPRAHPAHHDEHRPARPSRPRDARFDAGGRLVSTPRAAIGVDRSRLPGLRPVRASRSPPSSKSTLANGLRVWTRAPRRCAADRAPAARAARRGRRSARPRGPGGDDGRHARRGQRVAVGDRDAQELARIGAQLDTDIGSDATLVGLTALSRFTRPRPGAAGRRGRAARRSPRRTSRASASCG